MLPVLSLFAVFPVSAWPHGAWPRLQTWFLESELAAAHKLRRLLHSRNRQAAGHSSSSGKQPRDISSSEESERFCSSGPILSVEEANTMCAQAEATGWDLRPDLVRFCCSLGASHSAYAIMLEDPPITPIRLPLFSLFAYFCSRMRFSAKRAYSLLQKLVPACCCVPAVCLHCCRWIRYRSGPCMPSTARMQSRPPATGT